MGRAIQWHSDAWDEYCKWMQTDKATLKRINELIKDARRDSFGGIGKPEPLKHGLSGLWKVEHFNSTFSQPFCLFSCPSHSFSQKETPSVFSCQSVIESYVHKSTSSPQTREHPARNTAKQHLAPYRQEFRKDGQSLCFRKDIYT